ncbi:Ig-like domain-containing protein [Aphelenchoides besseyi]|nr:Ig-like domain-containing protein [Aphelenchoides besseyi]
MKQLLIIWLLLICWLRRTDGQLLPTAQVKISAHPFPVTSANQLTQFDWTMIGRTANQPIYCVSEQPVSQLRFICLDCPSKNITDIADVLGNNALDMTQTAGFPTVSLQNVEVNPNWTGISIVCQAKIHDGITGNSRTISSSPVVINVKYLRQVHVVDERNQFPVVIPDQGLHFYVECVRGVDQQCQPGRRKILRCAVQANPPATSFRWLKNGAQIGSSESSQEITIGTEMIGHSIQCQANNGLFAAEEGISSEAVYIDPYAAARVTGDNFQVTQSNPLFTAGNKIQINQKFTLTCAVEGNPRPTVYWRLRKSNGKVAYAACAQGDKGQYRELSTSGQGNMVRLTASCEIHVTNYSFSGQYWCSACSAVSRGLPECLPSLDSPGERVLNVQVQGSPMESEIPASVEQTETPDTAIVSVHYCAEPAPRPPRDVVFTIDNNDIQVGKSWQNFQFINILQNNSSPNCHMARLKVSPVREDDQSRQILLKLQNEYGNKQITVSLRDLLGVDGSDLAGIPSWILTILGLIALGLVCVFAVIICMRQQLLCFNEEKTAQAQYSNDNYKTPVSDNYSDDMQRGLYSSNGSEVMRPINDQQIYVSREAVV